MPCSEGVHGEHPERRETAETDGMCPTCALRRTLGSDPTSKGSPVSDAQGVADTWSEQLEIGGEVGAVTVYLHRVMRCSAEWGGWHWTADGLDEDHAREHLRQRLEQLDPFFGGAAYGRPGFPTDTESYRPMLEAVKHLDERIPQAMRDRLSGYVEALEERWRRDYPSA